MVKFILRFCRLIKIYFVLFRYGLDQIVLSSPLFYPFRFIAYLNPWNWKRPKYARGKRIRLALEELGPIFVKFGQLLSTRRDLIPSDIADELTELQDNVPPFSVDAVIPIIENAFNQSIDTLFQFFDRTPLASASIAQVHRAQLHDGKTVVVKIIRPHIDRIIERDIGLLYILAKILEKYWKPASRVHPLEVVKKFEMTILDELDLTREAANGSQLRRNFLHSPLLYIPQIYWPYVKRQVMVMEEIKGIPVADLPALQAANINLKLLAERGVEIFLTQVFKHSFFHADMHPGNIFVSPEHPESPQFIAIDFGIVGTLNRLDQRYLAENLMAFLRRDYQRVAELHIKSAWVGPNTRIEELESAIRVVCEPIFDRPIKEISMGQLLIRLLSIAKRFDMEVQPQLLLLQKTLIHVEGLGRQIYPELDLWQTAQPYLERWLKAQIGPRAFIKNFRDNAPFWLERLPELPDLLYDALKDRQSKTNLLVKQLEKLPMKKRPSSIASFLFGNTITLSSLGIGFFIMNPTTKILIMHPLWVIAWIGVALTSAIAAYCLK